MSTEPRVLVVENNDALRIMIFTILRHQPLAVDTATTAADALARVETCDYALILIDMDMPDQAALEFIDEFRRQRPEAQSFIIAVRDPNNELYLDPQKVSAVLNKPLEIDTLAELVRECAQVVPPPEDSVGCPPAESDVRMKLERGPYLTN